MKVVIAQMKEPDIFTSTAGLRHSFLTDVTNKFW